MRSKVGIVGLGHVGRGVQQLFPDALVYDKERSEVSLEKEAIDCEFAFVCVPTNEGANGAADLSAIEEVVGWIRADILVLRSTVPPGTSRRLSQETGRSIAFWPEFYGEWSYATPWEYSVEGWPSVILGGEPEITRAVVELLAPRLGAMKIYRQTSFENAELCKYMENAWLASQVVFAWQFRMLADACGSDYWEVRELWGLDPRVSKAHTAALVGKRGFDGKCLPKDLAALISAGKSRSVDVSLLEAIRRFNEMLHEVNGRDVG